MPGSWQMSPGSFPDKSVPMVSDYSSCHKFVPIENGRKGDDLFFQTDISILFSICAHRADDEVMPYVNNRRLRKHQQPGRALR